jgi:hypothetical protein
VRRNNAGMIASMAEKAMDEAAARSLFRRNEKKASAAIIQLFFVISEMNMVRFGTRSRPQNIRSTGMSGFPLINARCPG